MTDDTSDDGKWLTYQQLAEVRRISKPSAIRLVMRRHWRRHRDNERVVRVLVPHAMLEPDRTPYDASTPLRPGRWPRWSTRSRCCGIRLDVASARAERAEADKADERQRADNLRAQIDAERGRADRAEAAITGERALTDALRDRIGTTAAAEAEGTASDVEAPR